MNHWLGKEIDGVKRNNSGKDENFSMGLSLHSAMESLQSLSHANFQVNLPDTVHKWDWRYSFVLFIFSALNKILSTHRW